MCCLFGMLDYKNLLHQRQKNRILSVLSIAAEDRDGRHGNCLQHRGPALYLQAPQEALTKENSVRFTGLQKIQFIVQCFFKPILRKESFIILYENNS